MELVRYNLEREGFDVVSAPDGESGVSMAVEKMPGLVVLDLMLPGMDGLQVCRRLREDTRTTGIPVIMLTARGDAADRILGLEAGADDYVAKPFVPKELVARARAVLRRTTTEVIRNGDLELDPGRREVRFQGRPLPLRGAEFRSLHFLASCPGRVDVAPDSAQAEHLLGSILLTRKGVTKNQLYEALVAQERNPERKVGELLVVRGALREDHVERALRHQGEIFRRRRLFGRLLVEYGLATEFQVHGALRLQGWLADLGVTPAPKLGEILVQRGYLRRAAVEAALQLQGSVVYRCSECSVLLPVNSDHEILRCARCGHDSSTLYAQVAGAVHEIFAETARKLRIELPSDVKAAADESANHFGRYLLVQELGRGGAGIVYRAWEKERNRYVALKVLQCDRDTEGEEIRRFYSETRAIADLRHPHIVPLYDYGMLDRQFYFTMPYIDGVRLDAVRSRDVALRALAQAAAAVQFAHDHGVVHRDLKPGNILVDDRGHAWVIDFGLARVPRQSAETFPKGVILGTPYYMPPEQAEGDMEQVDERSDVYSLGAILYELVGGKSPYAGLSPDTVFDIVLHRPPHPVEELNHTAPADLVRIIRKAMSRDRAGRHASAGEFAAELLRCVEIPWESES